jgi:hypothetical protein
MIPMFIHNHIPLIQLGLQVLKNLPTKLALSKYLSILDARIQRRHMVPALVVTWLIWLMQTVEDLDSGFSGCGYGCNQVCDCVV